MTMPQQLYFNITFLFNLNVGVKPLPLSFFTHSQAVRAVDSLNSVPAYNDILQLEGLDSGEGPAAIDGAGQQLLNLCRFEPSKVEGKVPSKNYSSLKNQSTYSNMAVGLQNMQQYKRLEDYLKLNGGMELYNVQMRGTCMFASFRRCIDCPLETHLRRQIVVTVAENPEFFWPILALHIKGNYGHLRLDKATYDQKKKDKTLTQQEKEDYECTGPFSLIGYLKALLKRKFWRDEMVLMISSMMWQIGITVLTGETLRCIKFRHSMPYQRLMLFLLDLEGITMFLLVSPFVFCTAAICAVSEAIIIYTAAIESITAVIYMATS